MVYLVKRSEVFGGASGVAKSKATAVVAMTVLFECSFFLASVVDRSEACNRSEVQNSESVVFTLRLGSSKISGDIDSLRSIPNHRLWKTSYYFLESYRNRKL